MKVLTGFRWRMAVLSLLAFFPAAALCCDQIAAGQTIWIRLITPVSTYTAKPGDAVHGILTETIKCDNENAFPVGTYVSGVVHSVRKVGWGIRHETAALDIEFNQLHPSGASTFPLTAAVTEVENAREQVSRGVIQGIRSSDTPQGRINSRLRHLPTWNPYSDLGLIVYKATFSIFPEPEIYLPAGTDLRLKLEKSLPAPSPLLLTVADKPSDTSDDYEWEEFSRPMPERSETPQLNDADLVNLAFVGSREQVVTAFHDAGWVNSENLTTHSFMHQFYAFLNNSVYAQAPMRPFLLDGQPADMNWQKSLNSYARRDHLRMWKWSSSEDGKTVWLSASTHDAGAALSLKRHEFVHHISPDIDEERSKVIRDLTAAGCVQSVHMVQRPDVPRLTQNSSGDPVRTDGSLAVVELKTCHSPAPELATVPPPTPYKPGNKVFRYFRRQILTFRSDIWRANIIYGVYDLGHMSVMALKHHNSETAQRDRESKDPAQSVQTSASVTVVR